jgi:hypothetical protein
MSGWLKFLGIVQIIVGIPAVIGLVGILYIWVGYLLYKAGDLAATGNTEDLNEMMEKLKTVVIIAAVLTALGLLSMIFFLFVGGLGIFSAMNQSGGF